MSEVDIADKVATCTFCMKMCRFACPVSEASKHEMHTPYSKVEAFYQHYLKHSTIDDDRIELAFLCNHCGLCVEHCKHRNPIPEILTSIREKVIHEGRLSLSLKEGLNRAKVYYETRQKQAHDIMRREARFESSITMNEIDAGSIVFVPDYEAIRHSIKNAKNLLKLLQVKYNQAKLLVDPLDSVFFLYQIGESHRAEKQHQLLIDIFKTKAKVRFIFESEEVYYGYQSLYPSDYQDSISLLHNELDFTINNNAFQLQSSSFSLRLQLQEYIAILKAKHGNFIEAIPGGILQSGGADAELFASMFPEIFSEMMKRKWQELLQQKGDIIVSNYYDYAMLLEHRPRGLGRKLQYLMNHAV